MTSSSDQDLALKTLSPETDAAPPQDRLPYEAPRLVTLQLKKTANSPAGIVPDGAKLS